MNSPGHYPRSIRLREHRKPIDTHHFLPPAQTVPLPTAHKQPSKIDLWCLAYVGYRPRNPLLAPFLFGCVMTMGMDHDAHNQPPLANNKRPREAAFYPAQEDDQVYEPPARKRSRTWSTTSSPPTVVVMPPSDYPPQPSSSLLGRWSSLRQPALEEATYPSSGYSDDGEDSLESSLPLNHGALRSFWQIMTATNETNSDDDNIEYDYDCHHHYNSNDYASTNAPYADPPLFFPIHNSRLHRPIRWGRLWTCLLVSALAVWCNKVVTPRLVATATPVDHILVPAAGRPTANLTLRDFLTHKDGYSLGMAPAFFGFYGYFGSLAAWEQAVAADILKPPRLRSVAGASAGAMAAILVAAGVSPLHAALDFCAALRLSDFADPPGVLAVFRGKRFEQIMEEYLDKESMCESLLLEDANLPVAVSAFDLQTMSGQILCEGS